MSLYCSQCGSENDEKIVKCVSCGAAMSLDGPEALLGRTVFDSYCLEDILGQGGMAVVYLGRNKLTEQKVAVKVLSPELAGYDEIKTRFVEEARTLAKLEHPNIVHLINFAEDLGRLCLVMQYAEGDTLEDLIEDGGRLEPREALRVLAHVLDAMAHAHKHHVIHRDMKPSNIIVRKNGTVKVTDFGIAKVVRDTKLTEDGQTMGTVRYMSPEQVQGERIDERSDIYSLGITLYESVTGAPPFDGDNHFKIMNRHLKDMPKPPRDAGADISEKLQRVIMKALSKKREDRYASALEMRRALLKCPEAASLGKTGSAIFSKKGDTRTAGRAVSPGVAKSKLFVWLGGLAAVAVLAVGVVLLVVYPRSSGSDESLKREKGESESKTGDSYPADRSDKEPGDVVLERWKTEKHPILEKLEEKTKWEVETESRESPHLRIMSQVSVNAAEIESQYRRSLELYQRMLDSERVSETIKVRPLVIVLLSAELLADREVWKAEADADVRYYPLPVATLFLPADGEDAMPAMLYGFASHLCPARLSGSECHRLAETFEKYALSR